MVFRLGGKIVHVENHRRYFGDFSRFETPQPILRSAAKFSSRQSDTTTDGRPWYRLEFMRSNLSLQGTLRDKAAQRP